MRHIMAALAAAGIIATAAAGCAGEEAGRGAEGAGPLPRALSADELTVLEQAEGFLVRRCMEGQGFS